MLLLAQGEITGVFRRHVAHDDPASRLKESHLLIDAVQGGVNGIEQRLALPPIDGCEARSVAQRLQAHGHAGPPRIDMHHGRHARLQRRQPRGNGLRELLLQRPLERPGAELRVVPLVDDLLQRLFFNGQNRLPLAQAVAAEDVVDKHADDAAGLGAGELAEGHDATS